MESKKSLCLRFLKEKLFTKHYFLFFLFFQLFYLKGKLLSMIIFQKPESSTYPKDRKVFMKFVTSLFFISFIVSAQNLSPEEQKKLLEENKMLKDQLKKSKISPASPDSVKIMEALKRGEKFQKEQNQILHELDKEE
jgi:hypothetical protein